MLCPWQNCSTEWKGVKAAREQQKEPEEGEQQQHESPGEDVQGSGSGSSPTPTGPRVAPLPRRTDAKEQQANPKEEDSEVVIFGDINLSQDEVSLLNLGPKFMVCSNLSRENMMIESSVTMTKMCWGRSSRGQEQMSDCQAMEDDLETEESKVEAQRQMELLFCFQCLKLLA